MSSSLAEDPIQHAVYLLLDSLQTAFIHIHLPFGAFHAQYGKPDDRHYTIETEVEISDQFYGWLLGFGKRVKLVWPEDEREKFLAYVDKIRDAY